MLRRSTFDQSTLGGAQNPLSMNRYLYAHANPWTYVDPTGHNILCEGEYVNCEAHKQSVAEQKKKADKQKGEKQKADTKVRGRA
jgi:hypothetical protein